MILAGLMATLAADALFEVVSENKQSGAALTGEAFSGSSGHSQDKLHTSKARRRAGQCSAGATQHSCTGVLPEHKHFHIGFSSKPTNVVGFFFFFLQF